MKPLSGDELVGINQQAATVAASVLSEALVAATLTQSRIPFEKKFNHRSRWFGRGVTEQGAYDNRIQSPEVWLASGGLPDSFILALTASSIYVIEDKRQGVQLFAGQVLKSWVRSGFRASVDRRPLSSSVPTDCQLLRLTLPIEPVKNRAINRALQAAVERAEATGRPPAAEHAFVVGRDAPTEAVIKALDAEKRRGRSHCDNRRPGRRPCGRGRSAAALVGYGSTGTAPNRPPPPRAGVAACHRGDLRR